MDTAGRAAGAEETAARAQLVEGVGSLTGAPYERRHEALMEWAEEHGIDRGYAEQIYALAEEEELEPMLALQLVRAGIGVRELQEPEQDMDEEATQQAPPDWVAEDAVELDDVALERRLRATFRRLRAHVEASGSAKAAVDAMLREPDVGLVRLTGGDISS